MKSQMLVMVAGALVLVGCSASNTAVSNNVGSTAVVPDPGVSPSESSDDEFDLFEEQLDEAEVKIADPLAGWNRAMHNFNDKLYFWVLRPCARLCRKTVPRPARVSARNFFSNLSAPVRYFSCLLQGKRKAAGRELHRFAYNSTVGVLGLADPAKDKLGLEPAEEDLGQVLGKWGFGHGIYLVLPFFGPSSVRDAVGLVGDQFLNPIRYVEPTEASIAISAVKYTNENSFRLGEYESLKSTAVDPYAAMRNAYIQYRKKKVEE